MLIVGSVWHRMRMRMRMLTLAHAAVCGDPMTGFGRNCLTASADAAIVIC